MDPLAYKAIRSGMLVPFIKTSKVWCPLLLNYVWTHLGEVCITNDVKQVSTNLQAVATALYSKKNQSLLHVTFKRKARILTHGWWLFNGGSTKLLTWQLKLTGTAAWVIFNNTPFILTEQFINCQSFQLLSSTLYCSNLPCVWVKLNERK